jgi:transcriptional regulator with XRE-family HTH domain
MQLGQYIQDRRQNMGMSLSVLSREMGGSPGGSFLSKVEAAHADVSPAVAVRLASALSLPPEILLNAAGYATTDQVDGALNRLADLVGTPAPVMVPMPMIDPLNPDEPSPRMRAKLLRRKEDAFLIELEGMENEPYVGLAVVSRERKPNEGKAVIAVVDGRAGAWVWHTSRPTGDFLSRENGDKAAANFRVLGVILRVESEIDLDDTPEA